MLSVNRESFLRTVLLEFLEIIILCLEFFHHNLLFWPSILFFVQNKKGNLFIFFSTYNFGTLLFFCCNILCLITDIRYICRRLSKEGELPKDRYLFFSSVIIEHITGMTLLLFSNLSCEYLYSSNR